MMIRGQHEQKHGEEHLGGQLVGHVVDLQAALGAGRTCACMRMIESTREDPARSACTSDAAKKVIEFTWARSASSSSRPRNGWNRRPPWRRGRRPRRSPRPCGCRPPPARPSNDDPAEMQMAARSSASGSWRSSSSRHSGAGEQPRLRRGEPPGDGERRRGEPLHAADERQGDQTDGGAGRERRHADGSRTTLPAW